MFCLAFNRSSIAQGNQDLLGEASKRDSLIKTLNPLIMSGKANTQEVILFTAASILQCHSQGQWLRMLNNDCSKEALLQVQHRIENGVTADSLLMDHYMMLAYIATLNGKKEQAVENYIKTFSYSSYSLIRDFFDVEYELFRIGKENNLSIEITDRLVIEKESFSDLYTLSLLHFEKKENAKACDYFFKALNACQYDWQINVLYRHAEIIAKEQEKKEWQQFHDVNTKKEYLKKFWKIRDPNIVDGYNERLTEHYQRVFYAREFYDISREPYVDDRGKVFIRYGKPDRIYSSNLPEPNIRENESWIYEYIDGGLHFDFVLLEKGYELRPLGDAAIRWDKSIGGLFKARWDYHRYYSDIAIRFDSKRFANDWDLTSYSMYRMEWEKVQANAQKDHFEFPITAPHLQMNSNIISFKEGSGQSRIDFAYTIPYKELKFFSLAGANKSMLQIKVKLLDSLYRDVAYMEKEVPIEASSSEVSTLSYVDEIRTIVKPGLYRMGIEIRNNENQKIGIYRIDTLRVPDYSSPHLTLSDIQLAAKITPNVTEGPFVKPHTDLYVLPNPAAKIINMSPLNLYYEIYNLTLNNEGKSDYEITYRIEKSGGGNIFSRIFSGKGKSIAQSTRKQGNSTIQREYIGFDISELPEGKAMLEIRIKDLISNQETSSKLELNISDGKK